MIEREANEVILWLESIIESDEYSENDKALALAAVYDAANEYAQYYEGLKRYLQ